MAHTRRGGNSMANNITVDEKIAIIDGRIISGREKLDAVNLPHLYEEYGPVIDALENEKNRLKDLL